MVCHINNPNVISTGNVNYMSGAIYKIYSYVLT